MAPVPACSYRPTLPALNAGRSTSLSTGWNASRAQSAFSELQVKVAGERPRPPPRLYARH